MLQRSMLLDAIDTYFDGSGMRWHFAIPSASEIRALGIVFAKAVLPPQENTVIRIGLVGDRNQGKSTFIEAMLHSISDKQVSECRNVRLDDKSYLQAVYHSASRGWIRHYDCFLSGDSALASYRLNGQKTGLPWTDIVEHPQFDVHNKKFDCLLFLKSDKNNVRNVTFAVTPDLAASNRFQTFLTECSHWMVKSANDNAAAIVAPKPLRAAGPI